MQVDASVPVFLTKKIGGGELSFLLYEDQGPPLVLLHATGFLPWLWHPVARELGANHRIIAPYLCDHRPADPYRGGVDWYVLASDVAALLNELAVTRPFLVGHSMGGTVLAIAAGALGIEPAAMVLLEPVFLHREIYQMDLRVEDHPLAAKSIRRTSVWRSRNEAETYLRNHPVFSRWDEEVLALYLNHGLNEKDQAVRLACSPEMEAAIFMGGIRYDPWEVVPRITCPVLVVEGGESDQGRYVDLKRLAAGFPAGSHLLLPGVGHLMPMEKPLAVTAVIGDFIGSLKTR